MTITVVIYFIDVKVLMIWQYSVALYLSLFTITFHHRASKFATTFLREVEDRFIKIKITNPKNEKQPQRGKQQQEHTETTMSAFYIPCPTLLHLRENANFDQWISGCWFQKRTSLLLPSKILWRNSSWSLFLCFWESSDNFSWQPGQQSFGPVQFWLLLR